MHARFAHMQFQKKIFVLEKEDSHVVTIARHDDVPNNNTSEYVSFQSKPKPATDSGFFVAL